MPSETVQDTVSMKVTPSSSKGALGTWRFQDDSRTQSRGEVDPRSRNEPASKPWQVGVYVGQHLNLCGCGKACGGKPRSEPDSGNPTVRDRRGASGNVAMGAGLRPIAKAMDWPPDPKVRAPEIYPDPNRDRPGSFGSQMGHGKL